MDFHTIPHPGEFGFASWPPNAWKSAGAANNWAGMALDSRRGVVYVPTGSAVFDFYGADRLGNDLFADTLLALDAKTGKRLWHFQGVHHDIWDRDFPSPPALLHRKAPWQLRRCRRANNQAGYLYVFDRSNWEAAISHRGTSLSSERGSGRGYFANSALSHDAGPLYPTDADPAIYSRFGHRKRTQQR